MKEYKQKWNKNKLDQTSWILDRVNHPCRKCFVDYVLDNGIKSIVEIGAGALVEAKQLKNKVDNYTIIDVSTAFLGYAKEHGFNTIEACMTDLPDIEKVDMVYMCSVLEHTPDLYKTIEQIKKISKMFFITMFKWEYTDRTTVQYQEKKKYYSSTFGIGKIFEALSNEAEILFKAVCCCNGKIIPYGIYESEIGKSIQLDRRRHRNGNYLSIVGRWK